MASPAPKPAADQSPEPVTDSGLPLKPVYQAADAGPEAPPPGQYPFTRGIYPQMYRRRPWTIRQYAGFGSAAETNRRFRYLLEQGQTGLSVAFDLPTQMGHDADQRAGRSPAPALRTRRRAAGRRERPAQRHRAERHPQGVRGPRHVRLS